MTPAVSPLVEQSADAKLSWIDNGGGRTFLLALAEVVLPSEIGAAAIRPKPSNGSFAGCTSYDADAEMDHAMALRGCAGPGRLRPAGAPVLIALIDRQTAAALRRPKATFASAPLAVRRTIVEDSLRSVKGQRLLTRPGGNLIEDLMAFYFQSSAANDLCYRAAIGREACRGLPETEDPPSNSEFWKCRSATKRTF